MLTYQNLISNRLAAFGLRSLAAVSALALLILLTLSIGGTPTAGAQSASCETTDLGILGAEADAELSRDGLWTTSDCDSRFFTNSDAHTYRFQLVEGGRIRIGLSSDEADSYLYLLDADGTRITDNDDGGAGLDARIERDLAPGIYQIEATTVGGRGRGAADFSLSVSRVAGCDPVNLGALEPGVDLTATGSWTLDTCGSGFVPEHPAHRYLFTLSQGGRVLIDLKSDNGDPVLSLISPAAGVIGANDDGGEQRNARIERYLQPGAYLIEATTYLERDYQPLASDFTLIVQIVDEEAAQQSFKLKIEETHTPDTVVAGEPFSVNYRVSNLGGGDLADVGGSAYVYVVGPRVRYVIGPIYASAERWQAGVTYHSGPEVARAASVAIDELPPFEITFNRSGPTWVFVGVVTYDDQDQEVGFHGLWRNLTVLSTFAFNQLTVEVDESEYRVSARADNEGLVTVSVTSVDDRDAEVPASTRAKAIYTAGVQTQMLDGVFQRPSIAALEATGRSESVNVADPSSDTLLKLFRDQYVDAVSTSRLTEALAAGEVANPVKLEDLLLDIAETASARYASQATSWTTLQEQVQLVIPISPQQAFTFQSQLAYAERVLSPMVAAGEAVRASRDADLGWNAPEVQAMTAELEKLASCRAGTPALRHALDESDVANADALLHLDSEARAALPVYGLAVDSVLCAIPEADIASSRFLRTLAISNDREIQRLFGQEQPPAPVTPHLLRILAKLGDNDRIELGVELSSGRQVLPSMRYLPADSPVDEWIVSTDVEVGEGTIGRVRARRLANGQTELGFLTADGEAISPDIRFLPADMPVGVWLRTSVIQVPRAAVLQG